MEKDNSNGEDKPHASPSPQLWSEEEWCELLSYDYANVEMVAKDYPQDDNVPQISKSHNCDIDPGAGTLVMTDASSQINNHSNVMLHHPSEGDHDSLLHRPKSGFIDQQMIEETWSNFETNDPANADGVVIRDCPQNDNVPQQSQSHYRDIVPSVGNSVTDDCSQINNHTNVMHHYPREVDHQSLLHRPNSGFIDKQTIEGTGSNNFSTKNSAFTDIVPSVGNFAVDSSKNNNHSNVMRHHPHKGDHQALMHRPNSRFLSQHAPFNLNSVVGNVAVPPIDFNFSMPMFSPNQGAVSLNSPAMLEKKRLTSNSGSNTNMEVNTNLFGINVAGYESHRGSIRPLNTHRSMMDIKRILYPCFDSNNDIFRSQNNNKPMHVLPQNADFCTQSTNHHNLRPSARSAQPSLPRSSASPLGMATGGMNASNLGSLAEMKYMYDKALLSSAEMRYKRGASKPQSSLAQARQKRPHIPPCVPSRTTSVCSIPHTTQRSFASSHNAIPLSPQATFSTVSPPTPTCPNTYSSAPSFPHQAFADIRVPHHAKTIPSSLPWSQPKTETISPPPQPQMTLSLPQPHCQIEHKNISTRHQPQMTSSVPQPCSQTQTQNISPPHQPQMTPSIPQLCSQNKTQTKPISTPHQPQMTPTVPQSLSKRRCTKASKSKDEAVIKLSRIRCNGCNADLSYDPELSALTYPPPASRILQCGHAFHQFCLSSSCIVCKAQGIEGENMERDRKLD